MDNGGITGFGIIDILNPVPYMDAEGASYEDDAGSGRPGDGPPCHDAMTPYAMHLGRVALPRRIGVEEDLLCTCCLLHFIHVII